MDNLLSKLCSHRPDQKERGEVLVRKHCRTNAHKIYHISFLNHQLVRRNLWQKQIWELITLSLLFCISIAQSPHQGGKIESFESFENRWCWLSSSCPKVVPNLFQTCLKVVKKLSRLKAWVPSTPSKTAGGDGTLAGKPLIACFLSRKFESQNRHLPVCLAPDIRKCPIWNAWPRRHLWCGQWWMITTNCSVQKI